MENGSFQRKKSIVTEDLDERIRRLKTIRNTLLRTHPEDDSHEAIVALDERICWLERELERAHWQWVGGGL